MNSALGGENQANFLEVKVFFLLMNFEGTVKASLGLGSQVSSLPYSFSLL